MQRISHRSISPRFGVPMLIAAVVLITAGGARAVQGSVHAAPSAQQQPMLERFAVSGLPAGTATGNPVHATLPAGLNLKHIHGGPTFVYVIAGSLTIVESDGTTQTYGAGMFFWEGPGHIHTVIVPQSAEVFYLQFLPPGAEDTVPVQ